MSTTNSALHVFLKAYRSFFTLPKWQMFSTILFMRNKDQYSVNSLANIDHQAHDKILLAMRLVYFVIPV